MTLRQSRDEVRLGAHIAQWRRVVVDQVAGLADEADQRKRWFGLGPWNEGPADDIRLLLDHAAVLDFLARPDNGLTTPQAAALAALADALRQLRESTAVTLTPALIDDPRWRAIGRQAKATLGLLSTAD